MTSPFPSPECAPADHEWGDWAKQALQGVPYRHRWCDVCGAMQYDQTIAALSVQLDAARVVDEADPSDEDGVQ